MQDVVMVSSLENSERLKAKIGEYFSKGGYSEITLAIGMHSLLIDPQHTMADQAQLYRHILNLIKDKIKKNNPKTYSSWFAAFPKLIEELISKNQIIIDKAASDVLASHYAGFGTFNSVDAFFFWALEDRRLPLDQIVKYIEKTVERQHGRSPNAKI